MKNNYGRFKIMALISFILLLYAITLEANAGNTPHFIKVQTPQHEITGIVTGPQGLPIAGVAVYIEGKTNGTVTNLDGEYSIRAAPGDTLVFSYMGFRPVEIVLEPQQQQVNVQMEEDISSLGEVQINAGYYNTTRRESTGNISRVTAEEIEMQPVVSPLLALQGRMAGVEIIPAGVHPGMASTIRIRGRNSLRDDGNFPLYIIDGVPINSAPLESNSLLGATDPLNTLNPFNIASIEVLKDADATAIYGSRGANGVVLITTKKGRYGKTGLEARIYKGIVTVPNRLELLNTEQYLQIRKKAFENDGVEPTVDNAYDLVLWDQERYTDWQDFFFGGTSPITNVNLSTSGANENTSFRLSGSYHQQGTVYPADFDYQKVTAGVNLNHRSNDQKLSINLSVNYGLDFNNLIGSKDLNYFAFNLPPNAPAIYKENGTLNWEDWTEAGLTNPLEGIYNTTKTQSKNLLASLGISYQIFPDLSIKTNFGYSDLNNREKLKWPKRSYNPANWENIENRSVDIDLQRRSWIIEPHLNYNKRMGKANIEALIGATLQESENNQKSLFGEGYVSEALIGNLNAAERILSQEYLNGKYHYAAVFGRLGFDWDQKYYINLTGRRDGSSRFGPGKRIANFGAVGAAWIFSEEPLFQNHLIFLSFGKLRGSYGTTGNDQIGNYGYLDAYEATPGPGGLYPTALANPNYSWEVNKKMEAAIELGFFEDRLNLGLSWYRNRSSSQLVGYPLPSITGFTSVQANLPATVQNTGWEVEFSSYNFRTKNFRWDTSFNVSFPKNKLVDYPNIEQSSYATRYKVGYPLNISFLYQYEGIDPETGYYSIADVNEDGRFDFEDRTVIQDRSRDFYGGISNNLSY